MGTNYDHEKRKRYYQSPEWKALTRQVWSRAKGICERCHGDPVQATHHLTYKNLYHEKLSDLWGICNGCHDFLHRRSTFDPKKAVDPANLWYQIRKFMQR